MKNWFKPNTNLYKLAAELAALGTLAVLLATASFPQSPALAKALAQEQEREQPAPQEDEAPRPGQPLNCNNYAKGVTHKCDCARAQRCEKGKDGQWAIPEDPGSQCQTYCRKKACGCVHPCTTSQAKQPASAFPNCPRHAAKVVIQ